MGFCYNRFSILLNLVPINFYPRTAKRPLVSVRTRFAGVAWGATEHAMCDGVGQLSDPLEGHVI
jgi:hypothetical protein